MNRAAGFSLIEMMLVVTIGSLLSVVAIHGFTNMRQSNSIAGEASDFMGLMQYARAEALRQGSQMGVCVSSNGTGCTGGTAWNTGYIVFSDVNSSGGYSPGIDVMLRKQKGFTGTDTMTPSNTASVFLFNRLGFISNISANTTVLMTLHANVPTTTSTQCVEVTIVGKLTRYTAGNGGCT